MLAIVLNRTNALSAVPGCAASFVVFGEILLQGHKCGGKAA
jgi:hypothetical protein